MKQRGRPSSFAIAPPVADAGVLRVPRIAAPHDLTDEETEVWAAVVEAQSAEWFSPANVPILAQYCRHVIHCRRLAELIEKCTDDPEMDLRDYERLLRMQQRESWAMASLATKLRLTPQATIYQNGNKAGNKRRFGARTPWQDRESGGT